jgi:uncharacterized protein
MGHVERGVDEARQETWLAERMVDRQGRAEAAGRATSASGGCHYEVIHRGRLACDYIRGWLEYALEAYVRITAARPDAFTRADLGVGPSPERAPL